MQIYMGIDVTCCPILKPCGKYRAKHYRCYKCNDHVFKYEVGINVKTYEIVWLFGPITGSILDKTIYSLNLGNRDKDNLLDDEWVWADKGYIGCRRVITAYQKTIWHPELTEEEYQFNELHTRHHFTRIERVNGRLQHWGFTKTKWRHGSDDESQVFHKGCFFVTSGIHNIELKYNPLNYFDTLNP